MNKVYGEMTREELLACIDTLSKEYESIREMGLNLNIARGKPGADQLDLSMGMMTDCMNQSEMIAADGTDVRNYGIVDGLPEAKKLMGDMMGVRPEQVIVFGNSSLNIMYDSIARGYCFGILGSTPWCRQENLKFLCPVPGYDRHFSITEQFGFDMIDIPMKEDGPDMDLVEEYVNNDPSVKGIWCVPLYANPTGIVYSDEVVRRFAALKPAADDFRIFWDNAYVIHHLYDEEIAIPNILDECEKAGNPDMVYEFCSTSKVTFPGAGVAAMAASEKNIEEIRSRMSFQTIGHDKINQLRHVRFFGDIDGLRGHMKKHAAVIRPKFEAFYEVFDRELHGREIATWTKPHGGYFISFTTMPGCAKAIVARCRDAGLTLTGAGAAFPYGKDPEDSNIRIAPTFSTLEEIRQAAKLFAVCVKLVTAEKLLSQQQ